MTAPPGGKSGSSNRNGWLIGGIVGALILALIVSGGRSGASSPPDARHFKGSPRIGPLYYGVAPDQHSCNASVVDSPSRNLIVTAAHCVSGTGKGMKFLAGYDLLGHYGVWTVTAAYADQDWITRQNPLRDWAILSVAPQMYKGRRVNIEDVTGAFRLGFKSHPGQSILLAGAAAGTTRSVACRFDIRAYHNYSEFKCGGMGNDMAGAPMLLGPYGHRHILGVVGGLHTGGCRDNVTYAAQFGWSMWVTFARAHSGARSDVLPAANSSRC